MYISQESLRKLLQNTIAQGWNNGFNGADEYIEAQLSAMSDGEGEKECPRCHGEKIIDKNIPGNEGAPEMDVMVVCPECNGTGVEDAPTSAALGEKGIINCPCCGKEWDTKKHNACECGAVLASTFQIGKPIIKPSALDVKLDERVVKFFSRIYLIDAIEKFGDFYNNYKNIDPPKGLRTIIEEYVTTLPPAGQPTGMRHTARAIGLLNGVIDGINQVGKDLNIEGVIKVLNEIRHILDETPPTE